MRVQVKFKKSDDSVDGLAGGVPLGAILLWGGGNTMPTGTIASLSVKCSNFKLCDGIMLIPNLEDRIYYWC